MIRTLLEEYELFFLDGGCGTGRVAARKPVSDCRGHRSWILGEKEGNQILDGFSSGLTLENGSITSYTLATDNDGEAFFRQVCEAMRQNLGLMVYSSFRKNLESERMPGTSGGREPVGDSGQTVKDYEQAVEEAEEAQREQQESEKESDGEGEEQAEGKNRKPRQTPEAPQEFVNPIEVIRRIRIWGF